MKSYLKTALLPVFGLIALLGLAGQAQAAEMLPGIGVPAPLAENNISIAEMGVSYRFDQVGEQGKSLHSVPVQATFRLHNNGGAQTLEVAVPIFEINGQETRISAIFVNGKEESTGNVRRVTPYGMNEAIRAVTLFINVPENGDAILDVRLNQPIDYYSFPFLFQTGAGWSGNVHHGSLEAILPYQATNVFVDLRKVADNTLVPQTFNGRSAVWQFDDMALSDQSDVVLRIADPDAVQYFERGNERWQATKGDAESYLMMRNALLNMMPCNGVEVPAETWWRQMYDTMTMGVISTYPEGQERLQKALELWSGNWSVARGDEAKCTELKQRPERYRAALTQLLAIPGDQLTSASLETLKQHYQFLHELSSKLGDNSLASHEEDEDPSGYGDLSGTDKALLAQWDGRFTGNGQNALGAGNMDGSAAEKSSSSFVSSTISKIKNVFPKLSRGAQLALFGLLAVIVIIAVIILVLRWKEKDEPPTLPTYKSTTSSFGGSPNLVKNVTPPSPPTKTEPENILKTPEQKDELKKADATSADANKNDKPKLDEAYQDKKQEKYSTVINGVAIKNDKTQDGLIKPKTPKPNIAPTGKLPWEVGNKKIDDKKDVMNTKKDSDEHKPDQPKPTVNI